MTESGKARDGWTAALRWTARIFAVLVVVLLLWFLVESGTRVLAGLRLGQMQGLPLLLALAVAVIGVVIAWRWELVGGILALLGALAVIALVVAGSGVDTLTAALLFAAPLLVAGAFYLGCSARCRAMRGK